MQWAEAGMIATELEVQQLTSTDIQDNVARTAAKPSSKASKADTPVHVLHSIPIKDIPVNGEWKHHVRVRHTAEELQNTRQQILLQA
jgi:hypothetical protein